MTDSRPALYVDAAENDDDVRCFYELPDALVRAIHGAAHDLDPSTLSFDQAVHAMFMNLNAIADRLQGVDLDG